MRTYVRPESGVDLLFAVVAALAIFAVQALVAATAVAPRERLRAAFRRG